MSEAVKVARAEVVALFEALDFAMAHKWDNKRLTKKCKSIGEIADDSVELPDNIEATLIAIQEAVENGQAIEVVDESEVDDSDVDAAEPEPEAEVDAVEPETDDATEVAEEVPEPAADETLKPTKKKKRGRPAGLKNAKAEKKPKAEKAEALKKPKAPKAEKDRFGNVKGSKVAKINELLSADPKPLDWFIKETSFNRSSTYAHLGTLIKRGFAVKTANGFMEK